MLFIYTLDGKDESNLVFTCELKLDLSAWLWIARKYIAEDAMSNGEAQLLFRTWTFVF